MKKAKDKNSQKIKNISKKNSILDPVLEWCETLVAAVFVVIFCFTFIFRIAVVDGHSMESTLFENDRLIVSHLFYTPKQGDIVVIESEVLDKMIIKRIIAVGGQHVEIDYNADSVTVDGRAVEEDYVNYHHMSDTGSFSEEFYDSDRDVYEYDVPQDCVLVLGDNRNHSADSRTIGFVPTEDIVGKAELRFYSERAKLGRLE